MYDSMRLYPACIRPPVAHHPPRRPFHCSPQAQRALKALRPPCAPSLRPYPRASCLNHGFRNSLPLQIRLKSHREALRMTEMWLFEATIRLPTTYFDSPPGDHPCSLSGCRRGASKGAAPARDDRSPRPGAARCHLGSRAIAQEVYNLPLRPSAPWFTKAFRWLFACLGGLKSAFRAILRHDFTIPGAIELGLRTHLGLAAQQQLHASTLPRRRSQVQGGPT